VFLVSASSLSSSAQCVTLSFLAGKELQAQLARRLQHCYPTLRLVLAAARTVWFLERTHQAAGVDLGRYRPWYRQKEAPSQLDLVWTCWEALAEAGVFPIPRFAPDLAENPEEPENTLPLAA